jgi:plasmid stabilization system protein ParE
LTASILPEAEMDLEQAFDHYESKKPGLGRDLVHEFRRGVDRILEYPNAWAKLDEVYRRYRLHRFPYGIVYRVSDAGDQFRIIAVMNLSQKPGFWRDRDRH